jgi:hypothetical protein
MTPDKQIILYLILAILIFSIIKVLPNNTLKNYDIALISIITVILTKMLQDNNSKPKENFTELLTSIRDNLVKKEASLKKKASPKKEARPDKIDFPFTKRYLLSVVEDMVSVDTDDRLLRQMRSNAKSNQYYEILIQLLQTNRNAVYKNINTDHNIINELILDIKLKKKNALEELEKEKKNKKYVEEIVKSSRYVDGNGFVQNMMKGSDMRYNMYSAEEMEKLGTYDASFSNKWDQDYVLLNTDKWAPKFNHGMYKCKVEKKCPVCPNLEKGKYIPLKEFDQARKILPPDQMNVEYIKDKLLSGEA